MDFSKAFLDLLVHPVYKTPLYFNSENAFFYDPVNDARFPIRQNVPVLLTQNLEESLSQTGRHQTAGTRFDYKEHYQNDAVAYDYSEESSLPAEKEEIRRLHENILSAIPPDAEWVLDVGCGGAWLAKELAPAGRKVISMDISDINPIRALKKIPAPNHFALVADVFELPLKEDSIDCIIASEIIEHVPDPQRFLLALFAVLKPGGKLIVTTPYNEFIRTSLCIHCNRLTPHNAHLHSFTEQSIRKILPEETKKAGVRVLNSKLLVKAYIQKFLGFLPVSIWNRIDRAAIAVTGKKAYRLMAVIEK